MSQVFFSIFDPLAWAAVLFLIFRQGGRRPRGGSEARDRDNNGVPTRVTSSIRYRGMHGTENRSLSLSFSKPNVFCFYRSPAGADMKAVLLIFPETCDVHYLRLYALLQQSIWLGTSVGDRFIKE